MLVVTQRVDIQEAVSKGQQPLAIIQRNRASDVDSGRVPMASGRTFDSSEWRIVQERIVANEPAKFSRNLARSTDGLVRVPLFHYDVPEADAETLVTLGLQLGALICLQQPNAAERMIIVQGNVFARPDGKYGYRVWLGFAFRLEKNV